MTPREKVVLEACARADVRETKRGAVISFEDACAIATAELARRREHEPEGFFLVTAAEKAILTACAAVANPYEPTALEQEFVWAAEMARREGA